jgi:hypothetical protein
MNSRLADGASRARSALFLQVQVSGKRTDLRLSQVGSGWIDPDADHRRTYCQRFTTPIKNDAAIGWYGLEPDRACIAFTLEKSPLIQVQPGHTRNHAGCDQQEHDHQTVVTPGH